ncbi:MAG: hypothetical protein IJ111_08345 [Eggerthellaceae bacterium]|nr:hypothetical protein [Eggerthellaceae bacterium]
MRRTLKGFLKEYCRELSGIDTSNLRRLSAAAEDNARLVEPLFALAAVQGKADYLARISEGRWFHDDYERLVGKLVGYDSVEALLSSDDAPARYASVLDAFRAQGDGLAADRRINGLMRPRILDALAKKGLTRYKLCKDLGLNPGNVYAYLSGDDAKVSKETARRMLSYAEG